MRRVRAVSVVCLILVGSASLPLAAQASPGAPIRAGEHFLGLVNGTNKSPVVKTFCPGPVGPTSTGRVAGKQTMSVVHVPKGHGYTGRFSSIYAWFKPASGAAAPTQLHFTRFSSPQPIPNSVRVPCCGAGAVVFSACPYLAPCAAGWVTDTVKVQFVDIAA